ncbi:MAG: DNA gyrase inhibitor YacG [Gemmataceae bacterium]|nr:DNA gyrase inhibitor YacG [Gemmataceae bacterium]MDW8264347.1 DNA gyrase inhibitor YacG [Gemmataceae bacterium]
MIKVRCPICDQEMSGKSTADWPDFPFCSARCRLIDLGRWLGEQYRIPVVSDDEPRENTDERESP